MLAFKNIIKHQLRKIHLYVALSKTNSLHWYSKDRISPKPPDVTIPQQLRDSLRSGVPLTLLLTLLLSQKGEKMEDDMLRKIVKGNVITAPVIKDPFTSPSLTEQLRF